MKILFVSPDIEESARGINFILKSLISAAKEDGHEIGLLAGYPDAGGFAKSESIENRIEHLHLQNYMKNGRSSFKDMIPGGYRKRNLLKAALGLKIFRHKTYGVDQSFLADNSGVLKQIDFVVRSPFIYQFMTRNWKRITRWQIRKISRREKFDCVIIASPSIIRKKDVAGAKLVHFVHDTMPFELLETPQDNDTPARYAEQFYNSIHSSDLILANSLDTEKKVLEANKEAKTYVLFGAPSSKINTVAETSIVADKGLEPGSYLIFVSTVERRKNVEGLLEAYAKIHNQISMPLVLVGGPGYGFEDIHRKYMSLAREVRDDVRFMGYVSEEDKYTLLRNASAFVFPSFYEGFGLIIIEAFAAGLPVLTTNKGALPEAGDDAALYIENPYDTTEIGEKMLQITFDAKLRKTLVENSKKQVAKYSQEKFNARLHDALKLMD